MDTTFVLFTVLMFVAVVLAVEGVYLTWASKRSAEAKRLAARIRSLDGARELEALSLERRNARKPLQGFDEGPLTQLPGGLALRRWVDSAGTGQSVGSVLATTLALVAAGVLLPLMVGAPLVFGALAALVLGVLPWWWVGSRRKQRVAIFERQIPQTLDLMARAMRAGHAFGTAVKMAGDEMAEPIGREFRALADESNFGVPLNDALLHLAERVPVEDMRYFCIAVIIQRESGGNLAELLENIASIIRARLKLLGEVRTLSAEGKLSAWILGALPFAMAAMINLVNPEFMKVLWTDPAGLRMVGGALLLMACGVLWMRRIIDIRV